MILELINVVKKYRRCSYRLRGSLHRVDNNLVYITVAYHVYLGARERLLKLLEVIPHGREHGVEVILLPSLSHLLTYLSTAPGVISTAKDEYGVYFVLVKVSLVS